MNISFHMHKDKNNEKTTIRWNQLKKDQDWYYFIDGWLIHYFDKNKNYETTKIYIG
jgi:hypothetical protein